MAVLAKLFGAVDGTWFQPEFLLANAIGSVVLGVVGLFLRLWGTETLSVSTMLKLKTETSQLVRSGPFGLSRNPLYAGTIFILAAFSLFYGWLPMILFVLFHAIRFHRIVLYEEQQLSENLAEEFQSYKREVPRWFPISWRNATKGKIFPSWKTLVSNGPFVTIVAGLIIIAIRKNTVWLFPSLLFGLLITGLFLLTFRTRPHDTDL